VKMLRTQYNTEIIKYCHEQFGFELRSGYQLHLEILENNFQF